MKRTMLCLWLVLLGFGVSASELKWTTDLAAAQGRAKKENKMVLMNFTGSDWCGWCIKLHKEVFGTKQFAEYAAKNLVLVEVDFPARKKQSAALKKSNQALKSKYGARGFPTIVLLNSDGKQIWKQPGYLRGGPKAFIGKIEGARKK